MSDRELPWFRMYARMVDNESLRLLAFEDRWHYVALLCCMGQEIHMNNDLPLLRRKLAVKLGLDIPAFDEAIRRIAEVGLIDQETYIPTGWSSKQMESDSDPTGAERQKKYREKKKLEQEALRNALRNSDVTGLDKDKDTDIDKELKPICDKKEKSDAEKKRDAFDLFWLMYPKKKAKEHAYKSFMKIAIAEHEAILNALPLHIQSVDWKKDRGKFIPHPATWLNGKRWEDQITEIEGDSKHGNFSKQDYREGVAADGSF